MTARQTGGIARTVLAALLVLAASASARGQGAAARDAAPLRLAQAQDSPARPARGPASQTSLPEAAPPATPKRTTGATDQPPVVKQMNKAAKQRVEKEGK